ncbi:barstar family protein [Streptomyces sp. PTM05]|uniref:Barstar family protein n=2 Tax=Streptantibioticus parmotrematis TaxID=2873249 RepID=A0ABS7QVS9_9ACTN|nr:barstar family protein [Streptantibioticus parmotrematis]
MSVVRTGAFVPLGATLPPQGSTFCARLQGGGMGDVDGVFTQFYERLRLPDYFGWNWDALSDCLSDLHWLAEENVLLVVENAEALLNGDEEVRTDLFMTLRTGCSFWAEKPEVPLQRNISLRTVLVTAAERFSDMCEAVDEISA